MYQLIAVLSTLGKFLLTLWIAVFGRVQWQAPNWLAIGILPKLQQLFALLKAKPLKSLAGLLSLGVLLAGSFFAYRAYEHRPQPVKIDFVVSAPERTVIEEQAAPNPLVVTFAASVAPLNKVDQDVTAGIELQPAIAGVWHWVNDTTLEFRPKTDWPIATSHQVRFAPEALAEHVLLARKEFSFATPAFTVAVANSEFYQDPVNPKIKKANFTLQFSHPVNTTTLAKHIELQLKENTEKLNELQYTVSYDTLKLHAYIQSAVLEIPRNGRLVDLELSSGIQAANSEAESTEALQAQVTIPGLYDGLTIDNLELTVASNSKTQTQDQVLMISTSQAVHERDMLEAVEVYLLPEFSSNPDADQSEPYAWSSSEVSEAVLRQSQRLKVELVPAEHEYTQLHSLQVHADVKRTLYVKVFEHLKSFGGYLLNNTYEQTVVVPAFPPELHIMGEGSLLTLSGEHKMGVMTRNLSGLEVELGRVLPAQLQHLISQSQGDFAHPEFLGDFNADNLAERFTLKIPIDDATEGKPYYQAVDLGKYLQDAQGQQRRGLFLVTAKSYDPEAEQSETSADAETDNVDENYSADASEADEAAQEQRLILVTDLGIIAKTEQSGDQVLFVQSIQSGRPQVGAEVEVIAKNGQVLMHAITDNEGKVRFAKLSGLEREREPMLYLVRYQGDMSFLPLNRSDRRLNLSRFEIGGAENPQDAKQLDAYVFSDRGIYRPGDTMHIGMIVKTADWNSPLLGLPLEAEILDARDMVAKRFKLNLEAGGFNEISYTPLESAPTGKYTINLYTVKDDAAEQLLGSTTVKVEEFQPDQMKVAAKFSSGVTDGGWVHPKDLQAIVNVQNLYGAPAEARQVAAQLTLKPVLPEFKRYRSYQFYDPHYAKEGAKETLNNGVTDTQGNAVFALGLDKYQQASYQLNFTAQAFAAESGRSVATEASVLVSDLPYLIGYKLDGSLNFVAKAAPRNVHLIAIDPQLQLTASEALTLELVERKVLSVLTRQEDNTYRYESRPKEQSVRQTPMRIEKSGYELSLDTSNAGDYSYLLRNAQGVLLSRVDYSVAGEGNVSRSLDHNAELQITLNKAEYEPGENIILNIRAPYTGSGLITIERDKVYASAWFQASTQASVQSISVPQALLGNGYVNVQFVRDPGSDEIFTSPLSYGVAAFKVSTKAQTQALKLTVPEQVKPGENLSMKLKANEPTRVVVFAVDEGILQVARYKNPQPLEYFFQKRQLSVESAQILDLILPEFKKLLLASAAGGDTADDEAGSLLNPFKRKHDKPAVYWSGIIDLNGETELNYAVPETFNGSLKVMAVAVNDQRIASMVQKTLVRDDLIVTPNAPFMLAPGDEFSVSVAVANNIKGSGPQAPVQVKYLPTPGIEVLDAPEKALRIDEMHEGVTSFRLRVLDVEQAPLGNATLNFAVSSGAVQRQRHAYLSLRPATPRVNTLRFGSFSGQQDVAIERRLFPEQRKVSAGVSPLPLVAMTGLTDYLENYTHSCTEQLVSKAIPTVVLSKHPEFGKPRADSEARLQQMLSVLRSRQNSEGGFGLWTATPQAHPFASIYALHFLLDSLDNGLAIPDDMLQKTLAYAQTLAASPASDLSGLRVRAYAAYLLTRQGVVTSSMLSSIRESLRSNFPQDWQHDLAAVYLAASYQLLQQKPLADELLKAVMHSLAQQNSTPRFANFYDPMIYGAQSLYILAKHFPAEVRHLPPAMLQGFADAMQKQQFNSLSSAYFLLAYQAYIDAVPPAAVQELKIFATDSTGQSQALALPASFAPRTSFPLDTQNLRFAGPGSTPLYYVVSESGFDKVLPSKDQREGLEIQRSYLNKAGKAVTEVALGEEITVQLRLRSLDDELLANIAVQDLLPAGFEVVIPTPEQLADSNNVDASVDANPETSEVEDSEQLPVWQDRLTTGGNWQTEYIDIREDRVLLYGSIAKSMAEYRYQIKATVAGKFTAPAAYAQSMYEPMLQAHSVAGQMQVTESAAQ